LTEYEEFLVGYAERRLGRSLSASEKEQFKGLLTRRAAADLADSFAKPKPKVTPKPTPTPKPKPTPKKVIKDEE
jgi:hypothetical protein